MCKFWKELEMQGYEKFEIQTSLQKKENINVDERKEKMKENLKKLHF
jgi:hypothetical protein